VFGLALIAVLPVARAGAAEIKLMCPAPMRTTITELVEQFERKSPHKVTIVHTPSRMIIERITGGEAFDVSILTAEATDALIKQGKIAHRTEVARSSIGLGVRAGTPKPDVSSAEGVKRSLLAVKTFARNEGAESGKHMLAVFERLGIAEEMKARTKIQAMPTAIAPAVASGEAELGVFLTNVFNAPGVELAGPFPADLQQELVFSAAVATDAKDAVAARALLDFLKTPPAIAAIKAAGMTLG
jgi:molybdate transport system substrate-binding protein